MKLYFLILLTVLIVMPLSAKAKNKILSQYIRQKGFDEVYDISEGTFRPVPYEEAKEKDIWKKIKDYSGEFPVAYIEEEPTYDFDTQRAYGIWKIRPDLQKEFPDFHAKSTPSKWSMYDWYNKYGKQEYSDLNKNFFGLNVKGKEKDDWEKDVSGKNFSYDWGAKVAGYYQPGNDEIYYNNDLSLEQKKDIINHEIGHYLTKNISYDRLSELFSDFKDPKQKHPLNLLMERAAGAYSTYKRGRIDDKDWIKFFRDLEEKSYKAK